MAYVDRDRSRETAASGIAAALLVGGIGFVLVTGLAMTVVRTHAPPLVIHNWALPTPPPPPTASPTQNRTTHDAHVDVPTVIPTIVPIVSPDPTITLPPVDTAIGRPGTAATTLPPLTTTVDRSSGAAPRGDPADWVTSDDYPASALRAGQQGTTGFRLDVGVNGQAIACTITTSSGSDALDRTACRMLMHRAHFMPAHDAGGAPIAATYTSRIVWRVPAD